MGKYLLYAQIILILLLFYFGNLEKILSNGLLSIPFIAGLIFALWAFYNMGSKTYSPFPEPKQGGQIVQKGAYKYIRHPMYAGLILIAIPLFLSGPTITSFLIFACLIYTLDEKASLEEKLLLKKHSEYKIYQEKTKKFVPYLY